MVLWLQRYENNSICVFFSLAIDILSTINVQIMPYSVLIDVHPLFLIELQYNLIRRCSHQLLSILMRSIRTSESKKTFPITDRKTQKMNIKTFKTGNNRFQQPTDGGRVDKGFEQ